MNKSLRTITQCIALPVITLTLIIGNSSFALAKSNASVQKQLETNINGSWRAEKNRVRDQYRHPLQTLTFFGVQPNASVIELFPTGNAYYTEILAPFLRDKGELTIININGNPEDAGQKEKFTADPTHYDKIKTITLSQPTADAPPVLNFGAESSADYLLTFRNVHNFSMKDMQGIFFKEAFRVLKSGGILGIEDHRAAEGKTFAEVKNSGYQPEAFVITEAEKAGFKLVEASAINNNPKDTKDYPNGVWSLPPTFEEGEKDHAKYAAIGESDRFTLRFVKP